MIKLYGHLVLQRCYSQGAKSLCYGRPEVCEPAALAFPGDVGGAKAPLSEPPAALPSLAELGLSLEPWLLELGEVLVGSFLPSVELGLLLLLSELTPSLELWLLELGEALVGSLLPSIDPFLLLLASGLFGPVFPSAELSLLFLALSAFSVASRLVRPVELLVGSSEPLLVAVTASVFFCVLEEETLSSFA